MYKYCAEKSQSPSSQLDINTAFLLSARKGYLECLKYLHQEAKADIKHRNKQRKTALILSAEGNKNPKSPRGSKREQQQYLKCIKYLLTIEQVDVNAEDENGNTALYWSAYFGYQKRVEALLQENANIHHTNNDGDTALIISAKKGGMEGTSIHIVKNLVEQGANINAQAKDGNTALHWSAYNGNKQLISYLVSKDARTDIKNNNNMNALDLFSEHSYTDKEDKIKNLLLPNKAKK